MMIVLKIDGILVDQVDMWIDGSEREGENNAVSAHNSIGKDCSDSSLNRNNEERVCCWLFVLYSRDIDNIVE